MGLFDFLKKKANSMVETKPDELNKKIDDFQKKITSTESFGNKKSTTKAQNRVAKQIIKKFYYDYPETPYISDDRPNDWIERAEMFPQSIISIEMMTRNADNLLPGHIYMLYWLKKYTNKNVPSYFEYKYGIDFEKEKNFLCLKGFLDENNKPTDKGEEAIKKYADVIKKHTPPKTDRSVDGISKQILLQRDKIKNNGFKEYTFIANRDCCEICAQLNDKHFPISSFKIGVNAPPMHEGCRCSIVAYSDRKEYEEWLDFLEQGGTTAEYNKLKAQKVNSPLAKKKVE